MNQTEIKQIQRLFGLKQDGIVGSKTKKCINLVKRRKRILIIRKLFNE